ncbi:hypothetical protein VNO78_21583 [Psophocarpus tetragonolobus]|uniref:Uricase n=1 Tax=Psophocarpus tetragonolobus TaxID=3891 RepID=A0AAN9XI91_PSOTE
MAKQEVVEGFKFEQRHGKERVRVARVWKTRQGQHFIVEWRVGITLFSDCVNSYLSDDNTDIVATDTMKNTVYAKAKEGRDMLSAEDFAILLAKHFVSFYQKVTGAIVNIVENPWERVTVDGQPHEHGFKLGSEKHTTEAILQKSGSLQLTSGIEGLSVLKTTQSGFVNFIRDKYTALPDTRERMLATEVTALWRYSYESLYSLPQKPLYFTEKYQEVKKVLADTFFGPPNGGVYSPSVQNTLYLMAKATLNRFPDIAYVHLKMPNLHFLPVNISNQNGPIVKFEDDVYLPTDEPHGSIQASLSRLWSKL